MAQDRRTIARFRILSAFGDDTTPPWTGPRRDRRALLRHPVLRPADVSMLFGDTLVHDARARLENLSASGAFLTAETNPRHGRRAILRIEVGAGIGVAAGFVTRVREGRGFALELLDANAAFHAFVAALEARAWDEHVTITALIA